jgi:hypothetical protein
MSKTGPVLDRGGHLIGVVREPSDADSNEVLLIGPDQLWTATHAAPLGWRNSEGLRRTVTELLKHGFTRLSKYRTHRLTDGLWNGTFDAPSASVAKAGIAFVAEDENHPVQLRAWRDRSECQLMTSPRDPHNKGDKGDVFSNPPEGVAMVITNPRTKDGCPLEVRSNGGDLSALLLEVNALPETEATANLPRLETLLGEARASRSPSTPSPRGSEDALKADAQTTNDCSELPETSYTEGRKNGPIVHIPMRGTVGFCDMEEPFFTASDFTRAIRSAGASGASAIVLDIDSPGGRVDSEHEIIRELLLAQRLGYRVIANVRTAYSAAGLIAMSCKEIIVHPGAGIGAAVTWNGMESLDKMLMSDPALKAKMESPGLALQREMSEVSGHPACITGAMRFHREQLWWSPNGGFSDKSTGAKDEILLDNETSVLTLNASEIVKYGLGYECLLPTDIPAILQLEGREEQDLEATMDCTPKQRSEILKKYGGDENAAWPELETVLRRP